MSQDEKISLVDENDKIIGSKWRSELSDDQCWRGISIWIENGNGEVLVQQRSLAKNNSPGKWTPGVDGTVTEGGNYDETAVRELEEEIGLTGAKLEKKNKIHGKYEFGSRQMQGYIAVCDWHIERFTVQREEVARIEWMDKQQLLDEISDKTPHTRTWPSSCIYWHELFDLA